MFIYHSYNQFNRVDCRPVIICVNLKCIWFSHKLMVFNRVHSIVGNYPITWASLLTVLLCQMMETVY